MAYGSEYDTSNLFPIDEYQKFTKQKPEQIVEYLVYNIPLPAPTERFDVKAYEADSPTMLKIKSWRPLLHSYLIRNGIGSVIVTVFMGVILHLLGVERILLPVILAAFLTLTSSVLVGWLGLPRYQRNREIAESASVRSCVFRQHLVLWALSRYDFESAEQFEEMVEKEE